MWGAQQINITSGQKHGTFYSLWFIGFATRWASPESHLWWTYISIFCQSGVRVRRYGEKKGYPRQWKCGSFHFRCRNANWTLEALNSVKSIKLVSIWGDARRRLVNSVKTINRTSYILIFWKYKWQSPSQIHVNVFPRYRVPQFCVLLSNGISVSLILKRFYSL